MPSIEANETQAATGLVLDPAAHELLQRARELAGAEGQPSGALALLRAAAEPERLGPLLAELTRGVLDPAEAALLEAELLRRLQPGAAEAPVLDQPAAASLDELAERAGSLAAARREPAVRPLHLAQALVQLGLERHGDCFAAAELVLLRRLASGPRLAGAPPAQPHQDAIDLADYRIRSELLDLLPPKLCRQHDILPLKRSGETLYVASADPAHFDGHEDVSFWAGCASVELVRVTPESLHEAMARHLPDEGKALEPALASAVPPAGAEIEPPGALDAKSVPETFERLRRLMDLDPHDGRYYGIRGDLYLRIHYLREAAESYWKAVHVSEERGEWPEAVAYLRRLREVQPADREIYRHLVRCFGAMRMHDELLRAFGTFAELAARAGELQPALDLYVELTGRSLADPELQERLARAGQSYAGLLELIGAFSTLLKFHLGEQKSRDLYYLHVKLGLCYTRFGFNEEAIAHYKAAVEKCEPQGHPLWTVGSRLLADGEPARAIEMFLLALDEPVLALRDRLHVQYDLAMCCERRGDLFRAYQLLSDIRRIDERFLATDLAIRRLRTALHL
jgi:tetratricopeptide (TPR) repeat protein